MINLYQGDNMEAMAKMGDNSYDWGFVDPEYGNNASSPSIKPNTVKQKNGTVLRVEQRKYINKQWDNAPAPEEYFKELKRVTKNQIIWGVNYYSFPLTGGRIVWDKLNGESDQMDCEIAYCSINNRTDMVRYMWSGMFQGVYCGKDVQKASVQQGNKKLNEKRIHPTQKPIALYKWLLKNYAKPGDKILDTHLGSCSIAIACHDMGFDLDGWELDEDYYKSGVERYQNHIKQGSLFDPKEIYQPKKTETLFE